MLIFESWLTDIQNAYTNGVVGKRLSDVQKPKYGEVSPKIKQTLVTTMKEVTKLINEQINSRYQSFSKATGMLLMIAEINQLIDAGNYIGCRSRIQELNKLIKITNEYNAENGYEPILSDAAIGNLIEVERLFNEMFSTIING